MAKRRADDGAEDQGFRYCAVQPRIDPMLPAGLDPGRASILLVLADKWANGTELHYYFFTDEKVDGQQVTLANGKREWRTWVGADAQRKVVRAAFAKWKALGIGLSFKEVAKREEAEIRIGFMQGDGSWSYIGTDVLHHGPSERTMNFGWDLRGADGLDTALHEIGHTLGLPHEHQNPKAGIVWNEQAVYAALAKPPNKWSHDKTFYNIIRKIAPDTVQGSDWDPDSVMHYPFEAGLIAQPRKYAGGLTPAGGLSPRDKSWIQTFYPPQAPSDMRTLAPAVSQPLDVAPGGQADFLFTAPATRRYKVQTFGACDTQIVLFEEVGGAWRYLTADDDSGDDRNALVNPRLRDGQRYSVRVRLKHAAGGSPPSVMIW